MESPATGNSFYKRKKSEAGIKQYINPTLNTKIM
jgi:hypothetical protein